MRMARTEWMAIAASLALVCGAAADRLSLRSPVDAGPYHRVVREAAAALPLDVGEWVGHDLPVPPEAAAQLHPNVIISRGYVSRATGRHVSVLLVQCWDVRDLVPHYPPICYPGRGLTLTSSAPADWHALGTSVAGTEYQFESNTFETNKLTIVDNFMLLPDGRTCRDMGEVRKQVGLRTRFFGAAQVQVVFDSDTPADERARACEQFIAAYGPLVRAIGSGVHP